MAKNIICPVCGVINAVKEIPWREEKGEFFASQDICPCCGTHYGEDDWGEKKDEINKMHIILRKKWIHDGMIWKHQDKDSIEKKPKNWDPKKQLENIPQEFR